MGTADQKQIRTQKYRRAGEKAVVIGGSLAGLLAARVLSDHFKRVLVLEKDKIQNLPESRRGQPQTRHGHGLLANGLQILEQFFPGLTECLIGQGAITGDMGEVLRWYQFGDYRLKFTSGLVGIVASRPFLEWQIRKRVAALPNVSFIDGMQVANLILDKPGKRVTGIKFRDAAIPPLSELDLVVDATGRSGRTAAWIKRLGFPAPESEEVTVNIGYTSQVFRRRPDVEPEEVIMVLPSPPEGRQMAYLLPVEDDRWILTAAGWHGQHPPEDTRGLMRFLRDLPAPDIFNIVKDAEPLTGTEVFWIPSSKRVRYERLKAFPEGLLVLGDALASFNPVYGQGMTSAAMQAAALDDLLAQRRHGARLWKTYFRKTARLVDRIWQLTVGEDFRFPETQGKRPFGIDLINRYVRLVHLATHSDAQVYAAFLRVMNLLAPATSLMRPGMIWRVLKANFRRQFKPAGMGNMTGAHSIETLGG